MVPPLQEEPHAPFAQTSPSAQATSQLPQCAGSKSMSTHFPSQAVVPPPQVKAHCPP